MHLPSLLVRTGPGLVAAGVLAGLALVPASAEAAPAGESQGGQAGLIVVPSVADGGGCKSYVPDAHPREAKASCTKAAKGVEYRAGAVCSNGTMAYGGWHQQTANYWDNYSAAWCPVGSTVSESGFYVK